MIDGLKPYPAMKDSGVPWLGDVPEHWEVVKLRHCGSIVGGMTPSMSEPAFWGGDVPWVTPKDMKADIIQEASVKVTSAALAQTALRTVAAGSVLMVVRGMILARRVPVALAACPVTINQDMKAIVPVHDVRGAFLARLLAASQEAFSPLIDEAGHGTKRFPTERWRDLLFAFPPLDEQLAIARFIDHADRLVRRYVGARRKLIRLLEEQKQTIVHRAATRGLDPNVRLKPSGIEWLGEVPEHWEVRRLKSLFREVDDRTKTGTEILLSLRMHRGLVPHTEVSKVPISSEALIGFKRCQPGQLVMNRMRAAIGMFAIARQPGLVSPDYAVFDALEPINEDFILHLLRTPTMRTVFRIESKGLGTGSSGFMRLYSDRFGIIKIALPPLSEQDMIVRQLEAALSEINGGIENAKREVALLQEYRSRLIADVVTGKLDVRAAAAALPEAEEDTEATEPADDAAADETTADEEAEVEEAA